MKARFVRVNNDLKILCSDGTIANVGRNELSRILSGFKTIDSLTGNAGRWTDEYPDMAAFDGTTLAYVADSYDLIIKDFSPFRVLFDTLPDAGIEDVITVAEFASKYGKSVEQVKVYCREGRIPGVTKLGRDWLIPKDAEYPEDRRISVGRYLKR